MESEEWREIKGYEGIYQVSSLGRVRSLDRKVKFSDGRERKYGNKILSSKLSNRGYLMVTLWRNRNSQRLAIHRLVAKAFIPNPDNLPQVNHKDENKTNNRANNLEWCTNQYNNQYSKNTKIAQYDKQGNKIKEWGSIKEASLHLNIRANHITMCCKGVIKSCGGYCWKYSF